MKKENKGEKMESFFKIEKDVDLIIGLNLELKCLYIYNRFMQTDESIIFLVSSLYEATNFYQTLLNYTNDVLLFPMDDFISSEAIAISPELMITRLETIQAIIEKEKRIVITNLMGYLRFLPPKKLFIENKLEFKINDEYKIDDIISCCLKMGYKREILVNRTGDFAPRGFVFDIFPINEKNPIRISFFGETIESIRFFDVDTQQTIKKISKIKIYPSTEFLINEELESNNMTQKEIIKYLKPVNICDFFNKTKVIVNNYNDIKVSYKLLQEEMFNYQAGLNLKNVKYMHDFDQLEKDYIYLMDFDNEISDYKRKKIYDSKDVMPFIGDVEEINKRLNNYLLQKKEVVICMNNRENVNFLIQKLGNKKLVFTSFNQIFKNKINIIIKKINMGFEFLKIVVISENEILNYKKTKEQYKSRFKIGTKINDLTKIKIGDYVVHQVHGIARYGGIKKIKRDNLEKDYLTLEYYGNDKIYIPIEKIKIIKKYSNSSDFVPKLTRLGSPEWEKTKLRVKQKVKEMAFSLLELYAKREAIKGFSFLKDSEEQLEFEREFKYIDTIDQTKVSEEIKRDMENPFPMDRILCGDVGFGKTEVAFRAMFKAVLSNKQVAFLCPTTILSSQHYNNALERFKNFDVRIALLNRFVSYGKTKEILADIKEGKIDIVIGTHRILSNDVSFKNLGLLVIDEEQRFGVVHKEKIKNYKNNIDVLTLTATPIPRTLQMTFAGVRSLSLIQTPPNNRYPIQTYVMEYNNQVIKDAIYKEKSRDGQVFVLFNNIEKMPLKELEIKRLLPDLKITSIHGRMEKNKLEKITMDFYNHKYDVLLCTTIIETGIDISNVNTLIIIDADYFGLSQLYQIRGRVGRSNKIAYCYLMYDKRKILSEIASKRLKVIKDFTELGSSFSIAMRDLSIRGAGNILGSEQAGFIDTVGMEMFLNLLNNEIKKLKGEKVEETSDFNENPLLEVDTSIKDEYVFEEELKIEIHTKISTIDSYEKLYEVKNEIEDRFGSINEKMIIYMYKEWFEKLAHKLNIIDIKQTKTFIEIEINQQIINKINLQEFFNNVNKISKMFRFKTKKEKLLIILDFPKLDKHFIYYLIELLVLIEQSLL